MFGLIGLFTIIAIVGGGVSMVGVLAYLFHRVRRIESPQLGDPGLIQLGNQLEGMREELFTVQNEMARLTERLDFTEKLLMSGDGSEGEEKGPG